MQIDYIAPFSKAFNRMQKILFKPFHINKWFALGFTAFLAKLMDWEGGSSNRNEGGDHFDLGDILDLPYDAKDWMQNNPEWTTLIIFGILLFIGLIVLVTWLSSRGKFMFLDNVVYNRALVKQPWAEYKNLGNSLFTWRMGFGILSAVILGSYFSYIYLEIREMYYMDATDWEMFMTALRMGAFFLLLVIAASYISVFLNDFVVPLMYKNNSRAWIGWSQFVNLLTRNFVYFILYGLFYFALYIAVAIVIITFGFLTCCIGFLILIIPYIGSVLLLPVSVTFRALSLEFLQQFGEEYELFPNQESEIEPAG